jgi:hypothetical protein
MDIPKDLGQRIVEAARLAVATHLQLSHSLSDGASHQIGGADPVGNLSLPRAAKLPFAAIFAESEAP